jgi:hypothetical protein
MIRGRRGAAATEDVMEIRRGWVVVREFRQHWEAQIACGALEASGIPATVVDTPPFEGAVYEGPFLEPAYRVAVPGGNAGAARAILDAPAEGEGIVRKPDAG